MRNRLNSVAVRFVGALAVALCSVVQAATYHVTGDAAGGGDGSSWTSPMTIPEALAAAAAADEACEIWIAGTNVLAATPAEVTFARNITLRGGFVGNETSASARTAGTVSAIDGAATFNGPTISIGAGSTLTVERLTVTRGYARGFYKKGAGDVVLDACRFWNNATNATGNVAGGGARLDGGRAFVTNCVFDGNVVVRSRDARDYGHGLYLSSVSRAYIDDTLFATNGQRFGFSIPYGNAVAMGVGLTASGSPTTIRNCRFVANRSNHSGYADGGGAVYFGGNCSGSAISNTVFIGNEVVPRDNNTYPQTGVGAVQVLMDNVARTLDIANCTFAWNIATGGQNPADVQVTRGAVKVRNSIFYGSLVGAKTSAATGKCCDVRAYGGAKSTLDLDWCAFGIDTEFAVAAGGGGLLTMGANCATYDPLFVCGNPDFGIVNATGNVPYFPQSAAVLLAACDLHLKSAKGHWNPATGTYVKDAVTSPAIDSGDGSYANEPLPNGAALNLGAYGNTAEASLTPNGVPTLSDVTVVQDVDYTMPYFRFSLGGDDPYVATVTLFTGLTDAGEGDWDNTRVIATGAVSGDAFDAGAWKYYRKDDVVYWRLVAESFYGKAVKTGQLTITNTPPPWAGKGGGATVMHVRPGATGAGDGRDWSNAYADLATALQNFRKTSHNEIWFAGTNILAASFASASVPRALVLRGGFVGSEDAASERADGAVSVIDGGGSWNGPVVDVASGVALTVERLLVRRCPNRGFYKTGAGSATLRDCRFTGCGGNPSSSVSGGGARLDSGTAVVTNCVFDGNVMKVRDARDTGCGLYLNGLVSGAVDSCLFVTNGQTLANAASDGKDVVHGAGLFVNASKVAVRRSRFVANRSNQSCFANGGGALYLSGNCHGSAVSNCQFVGNMCVPRDGQNSGGSIGAGSIEIVLGSASRTCDVVNCTFACNTASGTVCPADIQAAQGVVKIRNCIFYGGVTGSKMSAGAGRYCVATTCSSIAGRVDADYCMFDWAPEKSVLGGNAVCGVNCVSNQPLFACGTLSPTVTGAGGYTPRYLSDQVPLLLGADLHLQSKAGRWSPASAAFVTDETSSPAIDAGDPDSDFSAEPDPNGVRVNLGAYGNTEEASKTFAVRPELSSVTVVTDVDYTQPYFRFSLTGEDDYVADVYLYFGLTDGGDGEAWEHVLQIGNAVPRGTALDAGTQCYFPTGTHLYWKIKVVKGSYAASRKGEADLTGATPPWYQKGGGAQVVHVRPGATGHGDGSCWTDAYQDWYTACRAFANDATKTEIWYAGTNVFSETTLGVSFARDVTLRGGFTGAENAAAARPAGRLAAIDGAETYNGPIVTVGSGATLTVERMCFRRGQCWGLGKTGAGNVVLRDCTFEYNGRGSGGETARCGASVSSGALTVSNCVFRGNGAPASRGAYLSGAGLKLSSVVPAVVDDCLFATNGVPLGDWPTHANGTVVFGSALYVGSSRACVRQCRFVGNRSNSSSFFACCGTVYLTGSSGGTVFTNCAFVANMNLGRDNNNVGQAGGLFQVTMDSNARTCEVVNCTFAWGLSGLPAWAVDMEVTKGTLRVRNSIFCGGNWANGTPAGTGRYAHVRGGVLDLDWTLFDVPVAEAVGCSSGTTNVGSHCLYAAPCLVTSADEFTVTDRGTYNARYDASSGNAIATANVHLRGRSGYIDECTGRLVKFHQKSPAIDAGDPASDFAREPETQTTGNGNRVNLGCYGNTPYATMSRIPGSVLRVR